MKILLKQGKLQGFRNTSCLTGKSFVSFLRIPYAKPPVNLLRFKPPQPHDGWTGILDATQNNTRCPQVDRFRNPPFVGDEDCLYINVHTPEDPNEIKKPKPVMVFIHGGAFCTGYGNMYRADYLINYDIILVTFNYRLHVFGFLNLDLPNCPGNVGLKDQVLALKWIRENIAAFGGDAANITVFGESAGAVGVHYLMVCPPSRGLFDKAILQSGSTICPFAFTDKKTKYAFRIGQLLGCITDDKEELLNFLLEVSAEDIINAHSALLKEMGKEDLIRLPFVPSVEERSAPDVMLPDHPKNLLKNVMKIPTMTGLNDLEGLIIVFGKPMSRLLLLNEKFNVFPDDIQALTERFPQIENKIREFYFGDKPISENTFPQLIDLFSDVVFSNNLYDVTRPILENGPETPVYFYKFSYNGAYNLLKQLVTIEFPGIDLEGPCHADELFYLFTVESGADFCLEGEEKFVDLMCSWWTNFAKFGSPTPSSSSWTPASLQQPSFLNITDKPKMKQGLIDERRMKFWKNLRRELKLLPSSTDSKL